MSTLTPATLSTVYVETQFSDTILVQEIDDMGTAYPANVISVTSNYDPLTNVFKFSNTFTTGSVTIYGAFSLNLFPSSIIQYITKGSSDKIETLVTTNSFDLIPTGKQVFNYQAPRAATIDVIFTITTNISFSQITKTVEYNYDTGRIKLLRYI